MKRTKTPFSEARQRLLETADRLFYTEGIHAVGIDRIIAEAGVAKMTLYTHFPSKDDLILAVLQYRETKVFEFFQVAMQKHNKRTKNKLLNFFAALNDWFESPGFRGCAFQNAAIEMADPNHAASQFARDHKRRFAELLRNLIEESLGKSASKQIPAIMLLVEGAILTCLIQGSSHSAEVAREATLRLLAETKEK